MRGPGFNPSYRFKRQQRPSTKGHRPPSPSLIDLSALRPPSPTLLDTQDPWGLPETTPSLPLDPIGEPYRDNFTDSESEGEGPESHESSPSPDEAEKDLRRLLEVVPRGSRSSHKAGVTSLISAPKQLVPAVPPVRTSDGSVLINLPNGSSVVFRPSAEEASAVTKTGKPGPLIPLSKPVLASGIEDALQTIRQLALERAPTAPQLGPPPARQRGPSRQPLQPRPPWNHQPLRVGPAPVAPSAPSKALPIKRPLPITSPKVPLTPSLSPPDTRSKATPPVAPLVLTSPPRSTSLKPAPVPVPRSPHSSPSTQFDPRLETSSDRPILLCSADEVGDLFRLNITPVPFPTIDFPSALKRAPKAKGRAGKSASQLVNPAAGLSSYIPQTDQAVSKRLDEVIGRLCPPITPANAGPRTQAEIKAEVQRILEGYGAARTGGSRGVKKLNPAARDWSASAPAAPAVEPEYEPVFDTQIELCDPPELSFTSSDHDELIYTPDDTAELQVDETDEEVLAQYRYYGGDEQGEDSMAIDQGNDLDALLSGHSGKVSHVSLVDVDSDDRSLSGTSAPHQSTDTPPFTRLIASRGAESAVTVTLPGQGKSHLQESVMKSWIASRGDERTRSSRVAYILQLVTRLTKLVNQEFDGYGSPLYPKGRFTVDVFGSVSWGGDTGSSGDIDLVIRDAEYPQGYEPSVWVAEDDATSQRSSANRQKTYRPGLCRIYDIHSVVQLLRRRGFADVLGIYQATTPIAKFKDPSRPGIECDVNVNDLGGWHNSRLILSYCEISPYVLRPLVHALKLWAKANHINDPSGSKGIPTMSSYCLTLMAIGYLQHRGVLPNLQEDVDVQIPEVASAGGKDIVWVGWGKPTGSKIHVGFSETAPPGWVSRDPDLDVGDAIRGFFSYFAKSSRATDNFEYTTQVVSILNGGIMQRAKTQGQETQEAQQRRANGEVTSREAMLERETRMGKGNLGIQPRNWGERRLVVQDPFIWQKNCTQSMSRLGLDRWLAALDVLPPPPSYIGPRKEAHLHAILILQAVERTHQHLEARGNTGQCTLETLLADCLPPPPAPAVSAPIIRRNFAPTLIAGMTPDGRPVSRFQFLGPNGYDPSGGRGRGFGVDGGRGRGRGRGSPSPAPGGPGRSVWR